MRVTYVAGFGAEYQSYVIKIWREKTENDIAAARWRGYITRVPSGERRYIQSLIDIPFFIGDCQEELNVNPGLRWKVFQWLYRWICSQMNEK